MTSTKIEVKEPTRKHLLLTDLKKNKSIYLMLVPVVAYYLLFHIVPMTGLAISFQNYNPARGVFGSDWVGLKHFVDFLSSYYAFRIIRNTLLISLYTLAVSFPAPIILALMLNEVRSVPFKRSVQTITYLPYFVSLVIVCGIARDFLRLDGVINQLIKLVGLKGTPFLLYPQWFRTVYVGTEVWQGIGWGSIIFLAALSAINPELYDSADIDGAGRWRKLWSITLPSIMPTIVILLILRIGSLMFVGHEKILLLYSPATYETADVISTFVYRKGILDLNFSYSTAVGFFNSVTNFILLIIANLISRKLDQESLW